MSIPDLHLYNAYKEIFNKTEPLRGTHVRPMGKRRSKTWVLIEKTGYDAALQQATDPVYIVRLYETDIVKVYPDGTCIVGTGGWDTNTTARRISDSLRKGFGYRVAWEMGAFKQANRVWLYSRGQSNYTKIPLTADGIRFRVKGGGLEPIDYKVQISVADRKATAPQYAKMRPFFDWMKSFVMLSDGWLMHQTRKEVLGTVENEADPAEVRASRFGYQMPPKSPSGKPVPYAFMLWAANGGYAPVQSDRQLAIEWLTNLHEDDYLLTFCLLAYINDPGNYGYSHAGMNEGLRPVETVETKFNGWPRRLVYYDVKQDLKRIKRAIQKLVVSESQKIVEIQPDDKIRRNVV